MRDLKSEIAKYLSQRQQTTTTAAALDADGGQGERADRDEREGVAWKVVTFIENRAILGEHAIGSTRPTT